MPTGHEYSTDLKNVFFRVIAFVEAEKTGPQIPLNNTTERIQAMLGISKGSVFNLKQEMKRLKDEQEAEKREEEQEEAKKKEEITKVQQNARMRLRPRSATMENPIYSQLDQTSAAASPSASHSKRYREPSIPTAESPMKQGNSGRPCLILNEQGQDAIRYHFHVMLTEKNLSDD
jgi:hypothetical protein